MNGKNLTPILISGVSCYEQDGTAYLRLEDVARGLGFTQTQKKNGVEYTSIRWETINRYLEEIGFPNKLGKDSYIPENIFYRLAMKAKNETAEKFQALVADEIIPSIRKTGSYTAKPLSRSELMAQALIAAHEELEHKDRQIAELAPKGLFADAVSASKQSILVGDLAKILKQNGVEIGATRLFQWMRDNGYLVRGNRSDKNMPTQRSMEMGWFDIKETVVSHSDGHTTINKTPKVTGKGQVYFVNLFLKRSWFSAPELDSKEAEA